MRLLRHKLHRYRGSLRYMWGSGKPLVFLRTLLNYLFYAVGIRRLRYVDLAVTYRCNLSCIHCSASRLSDPGRKEMTLDQYRSLGDQLVEQGVLVVQLTGGEPLLLPDLEGIIGVLHPRKTYISLATNSLLLTEERLSSLKKAGLDNVCVSIDDWNAEEFRKWRGREIHQCAFNTVEMVLRAGLSAMIFTVITHQNVRGANLIRLVEYARDAGVLILFGWAVPAGNWNRNTDVLLTEDDLAYLDTLYERYPHIRTDFDANYLAYGCGAVTEKLYVTAYGDVIPCAFLHVGFGNLAERSLGEIRRKALRYKEFTRYSSRCLAANDLEFREKHLPKIAGAEQEPVAARDFSFTVEEEP